jgi:hypothetical protein
MRRVGVAITLLLLVAVARAQDDDELLEPEPLGPPIAERLEALEREWAEDVGSPRRTEAPRGDEGKEGDETGLAEERPDVDAGEHDDDEQASRLSAGVGEAPRRAKGKTSRRGSRPRAADSDGDEDGVSSRSAGGKPVTSGAATPPSPGAKPAMNDPE